METTPSATPETMSTCKGVVVTGGVEPVAVVVVAGDSVWVAAEASGEAKERWLFGVVATAGRRPKACEADGAAGVVPDFLDGSSLGWVVGLPATGSSLNALSLLRGLPLSFDEPALLPLKSEIPMLINEADGAALKSDVGEALFETFALRCKALGTTGAAWTA